MSTSIDDVAVSGNTGTNGVGPDDTVLQLLELRRDVEFLSKRVNNLTYIFQGVQVLSNPLDSIKPVIKQLGLTDDQLCYGSLRDVKYCYPCSDRKYGVYRVSLSLELETQLLSKIKGPNSGLFILNKERGSSIPKLSIFPEKTERERIYHNYFQVTVKKVASYYSGRNIHFKIGRDYKVQVGLNTKYKQFEEILRENEDISVQTFSEYYDEYKKFESAKKRGRNGKSRQQTMESSTEIVVRDGPLAKRPKFQ